MRGIGAFRAMSHIIEFVVPLLVPGNQAKIKGFLGKMQDDGLFAGPRPSPTHVLCACNLAWVPDVKTEVRALAHPDTMWGYIVHGWSDCRLETEP